MAARLISGNRCERPVTGKSEDDDRWNLYEYKRQLLLGYKPGENRRGQDRPAPVPELLGAAIPSGTRSSRSWASRWYHSPMSSRELYLEGQGTIPSDTACFPAKLAHGHIEFLAKLGVDAIFYPCMTYNIDEGLGQNHYNCPVVAYYPEVLAGNCDCSEEHEIHLRLRGHPPAPRFHKEDDRRDGAGVRRPFPTERSRRRWRRPTENMSVT